MSQHFASSSTDLDHVSLTTQTSTLCSWMKWLRTERLHAAPSNCALKAAMVRLVHLGGIFFPDRGLFM